MNSKTIPLFLLLLASIISHGQTAQVSGYIYGTSYSEKVSGVSVAIEGLANATTSDSTGFYTMPGIEAGKYKVSFSRDGFLTRSIQVTLIAGQNLKLSVPLKVERVNLKEVDIRIKENSSGEVTVINQVDMKLRPVNSAQDLLRLVPGLFIAQHAGGGKAEQIFLRGFDIDHGTDFATYVDGIPVNMISHAHGQGYADLHFVIPETISELNAYLGPYSAAYGDMATAGAAEFKTANFIDRNQFKLEYGQFNTARGLLMLKLPENAHIFTKRKESAYFATEYRYSDSYFDITQKFNRFNFLGKYYALISDRTSLSFSLSNFNSSWDASGQIPERAVAAGYISRYGAIDPTEGGSTSRSNANLILETTLSPKASLKHQIYYSRYDFSLFSNFTFFKDNEAQGDGINQQDNRNILGYKTSYDLQSQVGKMKLRSSAAIGLRYDNAKVGLMHAAKRVILDTVVNGTLNQINAFAYVDERLSITNRLTLNLGLRYDAFNFDFQNNQQKDSSGNALASRLSPKLNLYYDLNSNVQLFVKSGIGFHSNDARAVIINQVNSYNDNILPRAFGQDIGTIVKLGKKAIVNVSLWNLDLENELVYVGDDGNVEAAGATSRQGVDLGVRYQFIPNLFFDFDANYCFSRLVGAPQGEHYIPLAPVFSSIAGLTYRGAKGFGGSLRYRYMSNRPANEDYSLTAKGYLVLDAAATYTLTKFQFGITIENLLNAEWNEAQFETESRLPNEASGTSVNEVHYTPGTPFSIRGSIAYFF